MANLGGPADACAKRTTEIVVPSGMAVADRGDRFARRPRWAVYRNRVLIVALCRPHRHRPLPRGG